jgi:hypothetical protein
LEEGINNNLGLDNPLPCNSGVIDTAVTLDLIFERLWLPLKEISFLIIRDAPDIRPAS